MAKTLITSIDIGSANTKVVVIERVDNKLKILARASVPTRGVERGYIMSPSETQESLASAIELIEKKLGEKVRDVILSASGTGLESHTEMASTVTTLGSGEVTDLDVTRSIEKAQKKAQKPNRKIVEYIATSYKLDGQDVVGAPTGMKGKRLETTVLFIDFPTTTIDILEDIFDALDIDILDIIPSPLACSCVSLSDIERKVGSVLVDIGSDTTELLVYEHDTPLLLKSIEFGSRDITNAIALGLKVNVDEADKIKHGGPVEKDTHVKKVSSIIEKKYTELFKEVNKELKAIDKKQLLPAGIILSGGGALARDIEELAKEQLCIPARKGSPRSVQRDSSERDIPWSVAYGVAVLGLERKHNGAYGSFGNLGSSVKNFMKKFFI